MAIAGPQCLGCNTRWEMDFILMDIIFEVKQLSPSLASAWIKLPLSDRLSGGYREILSADGWGFGADLFELKRCPSCPPVKENLDVTAPDYLAEVMVKLEGCGLKRSELIDLYQGQFVVSGVSVVEYLRLLKIDGVLDERDDSFFLKQRPT